MPVEGERETVRLLEHWGQKRSIVVGGGAVTLTGGAPFKKLTIVAAGGGAARGKKFGVVAKISWRLELV